MRLAHGIETEYIYIAELSRKLKFFNRDLKRGCLVYMFSLCFSGSNFLINLRWQFRVRKIFSCTWTFLYRRFCRICSPFILCSKFQKLNQWSDVWLELFLLERFPHPDKYPCEIGRSFADPSLKISIFSISTSHWVGRGGHMNTYQGGGASQGKIIPINRHFASLISGITSPLIGSGSPDKY